MFFAVLNELGPFLLVFVIFIFIFAIFQIILGSKADPGDYPGLHSNLRMLIQTFRLSIGDV